MRRKTTTAKEEEKKQKNQQNTGCHGARSGQTSCYREGRLVVVVVGAGALIVKYCARGHACDAVEGAADAATRSNVEREAAVSVALLA